MSRITLRIGSDSGRGRLVSLDLLLVLILTGLQRVQAEKPGEMVSGEGVGRG